MSDQVLPREAIRLGQRATDKNDAMFTREQQVPTYHGEGVAIPHGTNESRVHIKRTSLGFLQFPDGVDWDGETIHVCIPIASNSNAHLGILGALAGVLMEPATAEKLRTTTDPDEVLDLLSTVGEKN